VVVGDHRAIEHGVNIKNSRDAAQAGQNALLLGNHGPDRPLVGIDAGIGGGVAGGPVFEQRVFQNRSNAPAIPVHTLDRERRASRRSSGTAGFSYNPTRSVYSTSSA